MIRGDQSVPNIGVLALIGHTVCRLIKCSDDHHRSTAPNLIALHVNNSDRFYTCGLLAVSNIIPDVREASTKAAEPIYLTISHYTPELLNFHRWHYLMHSKHV